MLYDITERVYTDGQMGCRRAVAAFLVNARQVKQSNRSLHSEPQRGTESRSSNCSFGLSEDSSLLYIIYFFECQAKQPFCYKYFMKQRSEEHLKESKKALKPTALYFVEKLLFLFIELSY